MKNRKTARVTARDVANTVGVSQSTVSRVFNKNWTGYISEDVRKKVKDTAKKLGYHPNALANILNAKNSNIVAVVLSSVYDKFYSQVLINLSNILAENNMQTMLFTCAPTQDINEIIDRCLRYVPDAIIITSSAITHDVSPVFDAKNIPIVLFNGFVEGMDLNCVHGDNVQGCNLMAEHFANIGHKKIMYFSTGAGWYGTYHVRQKAFIEGLAKYGITDCEICNGYYFYEKSYEVAKEYFANNPPPEAILCAGDENTFAVIDAAAEVGLIAGENISIAGFFAPGMHSNDYGITCLKQDTYQMTIDVVNRVRELILNPDLDKKIITRPMTLHIGKSTMKPK